MNNTLLDSHQDEITNPMNLTTLISVISAVGGILTIITGYLLKAHIQHSSCWAGKCCDVSCVDAEEREEVEKTLKRVRTEKRKRDSIVFEKEHSTISIV